MSDIEDLKRLADSIAEMTQSETSLTREHDTTMRDISAIQAALVKLREKRDKEIADLKSLKVAKEEAQKKHDTLRMELDTKKVSRLSAAFIKKLDAKSKLFRWNKFLYEKQREGAYRIATERNMLLGDEMGTGKTITSIAAADLAGVRHLLIVCPAKLAGNFAAEIKKWSPHRYVLNIAQTNSVFKTANFDVLKALHGLKKPTALIVNYEGWSGDPKVIESLIDLQFEGFIADEAHHFKNKDTKAFKGLSRIVHANNTCIKCKGVLSQINKKCRNCGWELLHANAEELPRTRSMRKLQLPMTGTFLVNSPEDIWPALNLIMPKTFDSLNLFLNVFATTNEDGKWVFSSGGADRLVGKLGAKYLKRTMIDMGIDLPKQTITTERISLSGYTEQIEILNNLAKHAAIVLNQDATVNMTAIIAQITRQRQAAADPNSIVIKEENEFTGEIHETRLECDKVAKLDWIESRLSEDVLFNGKRVAVFTQFSSIIPEMKRRFESLGIKVAVCDGSTTPKQMEVIRSDFDRNFKDRGQFQVVIANFRVGGAGLNFTDITQTYEFDSPWNPAYRDQARARTQRIGQTEETNYVIMELEETIDQWMSAVVSYKQEMIDGFETAADANKQELTEILKAALSKGVTSEIN